MAEINATQGAQALAEKEGIDLSTVTGTLDDGRIQVSDVKDAVKARAAQPDAPQNPPTEPATPKPLSLVTDHRADAPTGIELDDEELDDNELDDDEDELVPMAQADTNPSPVIRTVTNAATVGPRTDALLTTRLDVGDEITDGRPVIDGDTGDHLEVLAPNRQFAGVRAGVSFADGRGLATAEQARRLVREFGYRCPALQG